jgi:phage terminase small subunit
MNRNLVISRAPKPPKHLQKEGRAFWREIAGSFELEPHHQQLLMRACEFIDTIATAQISLREVGSHYYEDRFGQPRSRPELAVIRDSSIALTRVLRELNLDVDSIPADSRPPLLARNTRGKQYA